MCEYAQAFFSPQKNPSVLRQSIYININSSCIDVLLGSVKKFQRFQNGHCLDEKELMR
jgi:hypothetical protein